MNKADNTYLDLLDYIMENGVDKGDRTGTGTRSIFGYQMRFNLKDSFPLLTSKKVLLKSVIHELIWFVRGDTKLRYLTQNKIGIWNEWPYKAYLKKCGLTVPSTESQEWKDGLVNFIERINNDDTFNDEHGDLGPIYGYQWRNWTGKDGKRYDQLGDVIKSLIEKPDDRRMIVSAWNVSEIDEMSKKALPPCHCLFQFYTKPAKENGGKRRLSCQLYQRSCDTFLGVPFNIASYALLTMMIAQVVNMEPDEFIWTGGDVHVYSNHFDQVKEQLSRRQNVPSSPKMRINPSVENIEDFTINDFELVGYEPLPAIKAPIAV